MPDPVNEPQTGSGEESSAQSGSTAGNQVGSAGDESRASGRTADQVYGELKRKHDKLSTQISELTAIIKDRFGAPAQGQAPQQQQQQYTPPQQGQFVSAYGAPRALGGFTDEQLNAALVNPTIPEQQKRLITQELYDRGEERRFNDRFEARERQSRIESVKKQSEKAAYDRFPALRDPDSEFSRKVNAALRDQRSTMGEFPTDIFDVATRVADSMGLEVRRAIVPGYTPQGDGERPVSQKPVQSVLSDELAEKLAKRFAHTLPSDVDKDGKVVRRQFNMKRVKDRSKNYGESEALVRTRGMKVEGQ